VALTTAQRKRIERRLHEERDRIQRDLNRSLGDQSGEDEQDRSGDLTKLPFHQADLGTDTIDAEVAASNETRMSRELEEINAALDRLYRDPERFGVCEDTGKNIPMERLEIIPWARTCRGAGA
jgi:DnaK suppressor protein